MRRAIRWRAETQEGADLCHPVAVTYPVRTRGGELGLERRGGGRAPALRNEWREPLRAQRDPLAESSGRVRSNRDERRRCRKQTWLGRFISTYGWRAYALPVLVVLTAVVVYQTITGTSVPAPKQAEGPVQGPPTIGRGEHGDHRRAAEGIDTVRRRPADRDPARGRSVHRGRSQDVAHRAGRRPAGRPGHHRRSFTYTVEVEDGIDTTTFGGDEAFARMVSRDAGQSRRAGRTIRSSRSPASTRRPGSSPTSGCR